MGQRHQLFVIAKIGQRYRVLAALHHQWLYGEGAVRRCLQILELLQSNAGMLRQELQAANDYEWKTLTPHVWPTRAERLAMTEQQRAEKDAMQTRKKTSFPMVTTYLTVAAAKNTIGGYNRVHVLPINYHPQRDCDNNDGYTVFDITHPEQPRYCFMADEHSAMAPVSARSYMRHYEEESVDVSFLDEYPLIGRNALLSAWPEEQPARPIQEEEASPLETPPMSQPLRAKAMEEVISQALKSDAGDLAWLDEAKQLPDFVEQAFSRLVLDPAMTAKPAGLHLLCHVLRDSRVVDLSYFGHLTPQQILQILHELRPATLILPRLECLTAAEVRALAQSPRLVDVRFGYTPGLDLTALTDALAGTNIRTFSHPELYRLSLIASDQVPEDLHGLPTASISKLFNNHPICQAVYLGVHHLPVRDGELRRCKLSGAPAWARHFSTISSSDYRTDHYSGIGMLTLPYGTQLLPIPLLDIPCRTQELLPRLYQAIATQITSLDYVSGMYSDFGVGIAMSLATGSDDHISPLPAELYCSYMAKGRSSIEPSPKVRPIVHGEWTLIVSQEREDVEQFKVASSTVRHCLVTRSEAGLLMSYTLEEFLDLAGITIDAGRLVAGLEHLNPSHGAKIRVAIGHCEREEVHEAVQAMDMYNAAIQTEYEGRRGEMLAASRARYS